MESQVQVHILNFSEFENLLFSERVKYTNDNGIILRNYYLNGSEDKIKNIEKRNWKC